MGGEQISFAFYFSSSLVARFLRTSLLQPPAGTLPTLWLG